jgi:hypothetical protein
MIQPPVFPALPGQGWSVHKRPTFSTRIASHVSGREVRLPLYSTPLWEFEVTFDALASDGRWPGLGAQSFQSLMSLYLECQGQFGPFVYMDPNDNRVIGRTLGIGDGSTRAFTLQRAVGNYLEPVSWVTAIARIALGGVTQTSGWSLQPPNQLVFAAAPAAGVVVVADFSFGFLCRFVTDQIDFENFMTGLWKVAKLAFRSIEP